MPRKKSGGARKRSKGIQTEEKLILRQEAEGEVYARVTTACGSGRFMVRCVQYTESNVPVLAPEPVMAILPGRMRKRKWRHMVTVNGYVLIQRRDYQADRVDILHKYDNTSEKKLVKMRHIPDDSGFMVGEDDGAVFDLQAADDMAPDAGASGGGASGGGASGGGVGEPAADEWQESFLDDI